MSPPDTAELYRALGVIEARACEGVDPGLWPRLDRLSLTLERVVGVPHANSVVWAHYVGVRRAASTGNGLLLTAAIDDLRDVLEAHLRHVGAAPAQ